VRFVNHDNREQIHRALQGFRRGWLMLLGVPLDFRNDYDLAWLLLLLGNFSDGTLMML
jgi:hypothetical protein